MQIDLNKYNPINWIGDFKKISLKTKIIKMDLNFLNFLNQDGIFIHQKYLNQHCLNKIQENKDQNNESDSDSEDPIDFYEFSQAEQISQIIKDFENRAFVKLNWKAARDSEGWVINQKCQSIEDVLTVLKASEIISDMNEQIFTNNLENDEEVDKRGGCYLVIKKHYNLDAAKEFRCFVKDKELVGICQRVTQHYYEHMKQQQQEITSQIKQFYEQNIQNTFDDNDYIFDVYVQDEFKIYLIDLNPFDNNFSNYLLFDGYDFDQNASSQQIIFKCIEDEYSTQKEDFSTNKVPMEFNEAIAQGDISSFFQTFKEQGNVQ